MFTIADVSVDDIKLENCGPPKPSNRSCISNEIKCGNKNICIQKNFLCDRVDDCGDGFDESLFMCSNEISKLCTFETDLCYWNISSTNSETEWMFRLTIVERFNIF